MVFYLHAAGPNSGPHACKPNDALANTFKKGKIDRRIIIVRKENKKTKNLNLTIKLENVETNWVKICKSYNRVSCNHSSKWRTEIVMSPQRCHLGVIRNQHSPAQLENGFSNRHLVSDCPFFRDG